MGADAQLGDIVHFRLQNGVERPAIVTQVHGETVNLLLFPDHDDGLPCPSYRTSVQRGDGPEQWHAANTIHQEVRDEPA